MKVTEERYLKQIREKWFRDNGNRIRSCKYCNKEYDFMNEGTPKYCSCKCRDESLKYQRRIGKVRRGDSSHRKRARHYDVEYEPVKRINVFIRDRYKCQDCGIRVQKNNYLKDNAAELDHIIPMSKGGGHLYSNVQTLCRKCNIDKGNNIEGQLRIAI